MITTRNQFGELFESVNKIGVGVEVGVQRGFFSKNISNKWSGQILCVDVWDEEDIYKEAIGLLSCEPFTMIRGKSTDIAKTIKDGSLDWVYIDADHSYKSVKKDYEAWLPKVRKGGIISGHDYGVNGDCEDVKKFIDELGVKNFNLTTDDFFEGRPYQSWWKIV